MQHEATYITMQLYINLNQGAIIEFGDFVPSRKFKKVIFIVCATACGGGGGGGGGC